MGEWVDVVPEAELPEGGRRVVETRIGAIAIFRVGGELFAVEDVCTHDGGELASGALEGEQIVCPRHGARFCVRTGKALTPPAYEDIETFPVRVAGGVVQVDVGD